MSDKSLFDIPMLMERNANSIGEAAREMLRGLKRTSNEDIDLSGDPVSLFVNEVIQIILDWMGTGEIEQVDELLGHIRIALNDEAEDIHCLDSLSLNSRLTVGLQGIGQFMAIFLRTSNLSKYLGLLSGKRRAAWCKALQWIYGYNQPVRVNDLCHIGLFTNDSTASNALNQLAAIGLLDKRKEDSQAVVYELTWPGRSVCKALQDADADTSRHDIGEATLVESAEEHRQEASPGVSYAVAFSYISPDMQERARKAQNIIIGVGWWSWR